MKSILEQLHVYLDRARIDLSAKAPNLVTALLVFGVFLLVAMAAQRIARRIMRRRNAPQEAIRVVGGLTFFVLLVPGILAALNEVDVNLGQMGFEVSILGAAIGFALKDLLTNIVSGLLILFSKPFVVGDQIRIKEYEGTVSAVGWRGTTLITYDGRHIIIPNTDVFTNPVINNTASALRRHSILIGVASDTNLERTSKLILDALDEMPDVAADPPPEVLVSQIADFDIKLEIRIWSAALQSEVKRINSEATQTIYAVLLANKIVMPLPTQVVQVYTQPTSS